MIHVDVKVIIFQNRSAEAERGFKHDISAGYSDNDDRQRFMKSESVDIGVSGENTCNGKMAKGDVTSERGALDSMRV
jgi:hypothetical protein